MIKLLKDNCGTSLDWERLAAPVRLASAFWQGLRQLFTKVHEQFFSKLRDWLDEWSVRRTLLNEFP